MRHRDTWLATIGCALLLLSGAAWADSADDAEAWVRQIYYEGFPPELAASLDGPAVERLAELLADPDEAEHHANIVLALGQSGHPLAYAPLAAYADTPLEGELDRAHFRARTWLYLAFGHLARVDARALRWLLDAYDADAPPSWHFRHHRDGALRVLLDELTLSGLALSGSPAAALRLDRVIAQSRGPDLAAKRRRRHAEAARATLAERRVSEPVR